MKGSVNMKFFKKISLGSEAKPHDAEAERDYVQDAAWIAESLP